MRPRALCTNFDTIQLYERVLLENCDQNVFSSPCGTSLTNCAQLIVQFYIRPARAFERQSCYAIGATFYDAPGIAVKF